SPRRPARRAPARRGRIHRRYLHLPRDGVQQLRPAARPGAAHDHEHRIALGGGIAMAKVRSSGGSGIGFPKPAEGSWTAHYPELGTEPMSYEDSISPEFYQLEREAIFKRAWLNVGRVEQLPRNGSYYTKELAVANTSIVVVRDMKGVVRAFH